MKSYLCVCKLYPFPELISGDFEAQVYNEFQKWEIFMPFLKALIIYNLPL